ncbi:MAG TPA: hypothetical protein VHO69_04295, partial [Phototrophicaceae bacterium]|nr:hypothetical protein [Phototrophicaceae bacterium]
MRSFVFTLLMLAFVLMTPAAPMQAQDEDFPPFAAYQADDYLYLFRPNEPPLRISEEPRPHPPRSFVWSPDGQVLAFQSGNSVTIFNLD